MLKERSGRFAAITVFVLLVPIFVNAYDTRLISLNSPVLINSTGLPGPGISAVLDTGDIWRLPGRLADPSLFPSHTVIVEYQAYGQASGGFVINGDPFYAGIFALQPEQNDWVIGIPRAYLGSWETFFSDANVSGTPPDPPSNIADVFLGIKLGQWLSAGAGAGWAYTMTQDTVTAIEGTEDSTTTDKASSSVITARAGVSIFLGPVSIDVGVVVPFSNYSSLYKSGANAPDPNQDDSVAANNKALNIGGRIFVSPSSNLELSVLGDYAMMMQNYSAKDNGDPLDTTTTRIDPVDFNSIGGGIGVNWMALENLLINNLITVESGEATHVKEEGSNNNRPQDSKRWIEAQFIIDTELELSTWLVLRAGVGMSFSWTTLGDNVDEGFLQSESTSFNFNPTGAAGLGFLIGDWLVLDLALNLQNFTSVNYFQTPFFQTTLTIKT